MKYLLGFLRFWRNFIIGDDPTIAIAILWSFVAVYSFMKINIHAWYLVPIVTAVLFAVLLERSFRAYIAQHKQHIKPRTSSLYPVDALWMPMMVTVIIPFFIFRFASLEFSLERFFLPITIISILVAIAVRLLIPYFHKYPALSSFVAAGFSLALIKFFEAPILKFFGMIAEQAYFANIVILVISASILWALVRRIVERRELTA